ncbi:MAG: hydrogenase nickel incorporation protein HypB [Erysipelotrichaceae bacterium]|nr:hydrogenase nickel incorporation protein HypB [Erysipelotrichaceae bacterium]
MYKIIETKERVIEDNNLVADNTRKELRKRNIYFINIMASPGAGKTTLLTQIIPLLKEKYRIAVMEADVDSSVDAATVEKLGVRVIQLHSGGLCHMDADMTYRGLAELGLEDTDLIFLENIGNLVCPAEFDTGANLKLMILSVPEGADKPLKYPLMFQTSDVVLVNKADTMEVFDFSREAFERNLRTRNEKAPVFYISALNGDGIREVTDYLIRLIDEERKQA